ncbi:MAG: hypothetical protein GY768_07660 [Planctomycetaceae bacterium]|nr:hypothetical protein [Planctomycetaceae bacterium]
MADPDNNSITSDSDQEQLVAYLDGEVDASTAQSVEERLASDSAFRQSLNELQRSWDLLGDLPQPTIDESFTQTTVEMVALQLDHDLQDDQDNQTQKQNLRWLTLLAAATVSLLIGFFAYRFWLDAPNRELKTDLPVIERVDVYQHIDNLQFLEQLKEEGVFDAPVEEESTTAFP